MLIIYAHPNKEGHCGYILEKTLENLKKENKNYHLLDLYAEKFNPVLAPEEHYSSGKKDFGEDILKYQELLKKYNRILIIYPTWWNGAPAILKGFFDKILTGGFAFHYENGKPIAHLKGKVAAICTTGGPKLYSKIFAKNSALLNVTRYTFGFCGYKSKGFLIGNSNKLTEKQKTKIKNIVPKALEYLK